MALIVSLFNGFEGSAAVALRPFSLAFLNSFSSALLASTEAETAGLTGTTAGRCGWSCGEGTRRGGEGGGAASAGGSLRAGCSAGAWTEELAAAFAFALFSILFNFRTVFS